MDGKGGNPYSVASGKLPYPPLTMRHQLTFLHHCLLFSATGIQCTIDVHTPLDRDQVVQLRQYLALICQDSVDVLHQYLAIIKYALSPVAGGCTCTVMCCIWYSSLYSCYRKHTYTWERYTCTCTRSLLIIHCFFSMQLVVSFVLLDNGILRVLLYLF